MRKEHLVIWGVMGVVALTEIVGAILLVTKAARLKNQAESPSAVRSGTVAAAVAGGQQAETNRQETATGAEVEAPSGEAEAVAVEAKPKKKPLPPKPYVRFKDKGRYLPPLGNRSLRLESLLVTNIATSICRVEPRNVVQLLAREEQKYSRGSWEIDAEETEELAGRTETNLLHSVTAEPLLPVKIKDGGPTNGIFLVSVCDASRRRCDYSWDDPGKYNPRRYRLVCLSDLGLSVRRNGQRLGVWVLSLSRGRPLAETLVEVYSSANILLGTGTTDAFGWCTIECGEAGEPFAVVAIRPEAQDMTFMALADSMEVDERFPEGARDEYLAKKGLDAFVWTDRGIYRHEEKIFLHALLRDARLQAPEPLPIQLTLINPRGEAYAKKTLLTDEFGSLSYAGFSVPAEQPSGVWKLQVGTPGGKLSERMVRIEEFVPPQIRVKVTAEEHQHPTNFSFRIAAEHLFGAPASSLASEGVVVFRDVPFAPEQWPGFGFGNNGLGLRANFQRFNRQTLDCHGETVYFAPLLAENGQPKAAVQVTAQGVVLEDGGRPAAARKTLVCHYYPFYLGTNLPEWLKLPGEGGAKIEVVAVNSEGELVRGRRKLTMKIERIDSVYTYQKNEYGGYSWNCEQVRSLENEQSFVLGEEGRSEYELPLDQCGDYSLLITDDETGVSYARSFYLSNWGDETVRTARGQPTAVTLTTDKPFYRVGETPRLIVRSPFCGQAMLTLQREREVYTEFIDLTNATSEVVLRPVERDWAPNVDVMISVVQSVEASVKRLAARAHGEATIWVRPVEHELKVTLASEVNWSATVGGNASVRVQVAAPGAEEVMVTLVDEGINLLTDEPEPDPIGYLSRARTAEHPLYDLYGRILPVVGETLRASGIKTGGCADDDMLERVSPQPSKRFRPLAQWIKVGLREGRGETVFELPEFVGELRVTAVAYSAMATGSASRRQQVAPKLVMQPDAPRFAAPGDEFEVTLPLRNCSDEAGEIAYSLVGSVTGKVWLAKGAATNLTLRVRARSTPGEMALHYRASGLGEMHEQTLLLPIRAAVPWQLTRGVATDETSARQAAGVQPGDRFSLTRWENPMGEFSAALEWLAEYPHGCLEQTSSRMFPLLNGNPEHFAYVAAGVRRVESMIRETDFTMWPDCNYAPWDREVSVYAAHFLFAAERAGHQLAPRTKGRVIRMLKSWVTDLSDAISAYVCHTLVLAGAQDLDRMLLLYDRRTKLDALSRARLSRAFAMIHDRERAKTLLDFAYEPQSIKEAAFTVLALLELDANDQRIPTLVRYLADQRDKAQYSWGTTDTNAHALMAIGAYYRRYPEQAQRPFYLWKRLSLPKTVVTEAHGISIRRRLLRADGTEAEAADLRCGELLFAELILTSDVTRVVNDLVIEDLLPAAFEPILDPMLAVRSPEGTGSQGPAEGVSPLPSWVMRKEARDDRMLVFSKRFMIAQNEEIKVQYPVRVVTAGDFTLPGPSVEGMYNPELRARCAPGRIVVGH